MRINADLPGGGRFEYKREPMPEARFRAVCGIFAGVVYATAIIAITAMCGVPGLIVTCFAAGLTAAVAIAVK